MTTEKNNQINIFKQIFCFFRTILLILVMIFSAIFIVFIMLFIWAFLPRRYLFMYYANFWCASFCLFIKYICGVKYIIKGKENIQGVSIKNKTPAVFVSNHQSQWETIVFPWLITPMIFVLKRSLLLLPISAVAIIMLKHIVINRSNKLESFKKVINQGKKNLKDGFSIIIFPEGTRVPPFIRLPFFKSAANLAKSAKVPIIPIAIDSGFFWPAKKFIIYPGTVTVIIGPKIETDNLTTSEAHEKSVNWILENMKKLEQNHIK